MIGTWDIASSGYADDYALIKIDNLQFKTTRPAGD